MPKVIPADSVLEIPLKGQLEADGENRARNAAERPALTVRATGRGEPTSGIADSWAVTCRQT